MHTSFQGGTLGYPEPETSPNGAPLTEAAKAILGIRTDAAAHSRAKGAANASATGAEANFGTADDMCAAPRRNAPAQPPGRRRAPPPPALLGASAREDTAAARSARTDT